MATPRITRSQAARMRHLPLATGLSTFRKSSRRRVQTDAGPVRPPSRSCPNTQTPGTVSRGPMPSRLECGSTCGPSLEEDVASFMSSEYDCHLGEADFEDGVVAAGRSGHDSPPAAGSQAPKPRVRFITGYIDESGHYSSGLSDSFDFLGVVREGRSDAPTPDFHPHAFHRHSSNEDTDMNVASGYSKKYYKGRSIQDEMQNTLFSSGIMIEGPDLTPFVKIAERASARLRRQRKCARTTDKYVPQIGLGRRIRTRMALPYRILRNSSARGVFMAIGSMHQTLRALMLFEMGFR
ncbi:hypothetical protein M3J07_013855 [Ascochyta lentis]